MRTRLHARSIGGACAFVLLAAAGGLEPPCRAGTDEGSCPEEWELENFQPRSPTYQQPVPSSSYQDRTTVLMLLASW